MAYWSHELSNIGKWTDLDDVQNDVKQNMNREEVESSDGSRTIQAKCLKELECLQTKAIPIGNLV